MLAGQDDEDLDPEVDENELACKADAGPAGVVLDLDAKPEAAKQNSRTDYVSEVQVQVSHYPGAYRIPAACCLCISSAAARIAGSS